MTLEKLHTSLLTPSELIVSGNRLASTIEDAALGEDFIERIVQLVKYDINKLESVLHDDLVDNATEDLVHKDALRDDAFTAMRDFVKACASRKDSEIAGAGKYLVMLFQKHGWALHHESYVRESSKLALLFDDLSQPEAMSAMKKLGATSWFEELKLAEKEFEKTYQETQSPEVRMNYTRFGKVRGTLSKHLQTLLDCVGVISDTKSTESVKVVITKLNEIISEVVNSAKDRRKAEMVG